VLNGKTRYEQFNKIEWVHESTGELRGGRRRRIFIGEFVRGVILAAIFGALLVLVLAAYGG
jgi:hypothetical protein